MGKDVDLSELITQARLGDRESVDQLAQAVEPRLRAFIRRTTLNDELTNDLVQETLLQMVKSLNSLKKVESFWPWVFRIASRKINEFFWRRKRIPEVQFSALGDSLLESVLKDDSGKAHSPAMRRELGRLILEAIAKLKHSQRAILSLRCFEGLSYSEIAEAVGCSEMEARVSFFRAKHSLKKQLSRRGFSKSSLLLALALFGRLTVPSEAATVGITVSSGALKGIGVPAMLLGLTAQRWAKILATAAGFIFVTFACWYFWPDSVLNRADVRSVYFAVRGIGQASNLSSSSNIAVEAGENTDLVTSGLYETWIYLPEGPDGPIIRRDQRWNTEQTEELCAWLQDGEANYYYYANPENPAIYITNDMVSALLLPTDPPQLANFLLEMCGRDPRVEYIHDKTSGLLTGRIDNRLPAFKNLKTTYEYNKLDRDFFRYDWPEEIKVVDQRDTMHKRGWTYFRIIGRIGNNDISGWGRIPFVYAAYKQHSPWLELRIAEQLRIIDTSGGAYLLDGSGAVLARYPAGSFFKGLARPWTGISAYDIVRRDAARKRIRFDYKQDDKKGLVTLRKDRDYSHTRIVYFINIKKDIIESISFSITGGPESVQGAIKLSYLDDITQAGNEFAEPAPISSCQLPPQKPMGTSWLFQLVEGGLVD